jgi:hypothetical protein
MSMISRYQKSGGFLQLLQLIETCGKQKQDNFLGMIEKEDVRWAHAIREKMLTIEKIFSWNDQVLAEVAARLQQLTLATAMHGLKPEDGERLLQTFSHSQRRNVEDLKKSKSPAPAEISSAFLKILQEVRSMITQGYLRPEKFAPEMQIPAEYEEKLSKEPIFKTFKEETPAAPDMSGFGSTAAPVTPISHMSAAAGHDADTAALRARVQALTHENTQLKTQVRILQEKLLQIKKIA